MIFAPGQMENGDSESHFPVTPRPLTGEHWDYFRVVRHSPRRFDVGGSAADPRHASAGVRRALHALCGPGSVVSGRPRISQER